LHSFILSNFSKTAVQDKICEITDIGLLPSSFDQQSDIYQIYPQINVKTVLQKPSIKIEQVRQFQLEFNKKPLKLPVQIAILWQAQYLTLVASNALLKILEEPVDQSFVFLSVDSYHRLLPTIQSRCQIINAINKEQESGNKATGDIDLKILYQSQVGERMEIITKACPTQQEALVWLKSLMTVAREKLPKSSAKGMKSLGRLLLNCQMIYNDIAINNVNYKLALDMLIMKWDKEV